ncbi:hypothetical protein B1992_06810 [Pseudoxanthomonas broegbernensis]|uniref:Glycosyl transferase family 1 domain-containing protein n=1 Tax=Pseudoxanthomonas broegbernensis TaxID=83619 RepID=A0A7V8GMM6_9GAMM|nr:glycosyltransferase [Pseudoxanthomonas broegbernensis]KAF1686616.1 hypothetical protein B1992_06810 [Pseudoxanthomonas broegbernensis]MBB6063632.1 glycosyltransferase involved in cell wall biosynthesis [Pseudoxanthomonas broegbernensis]
MSRGRMLFHRDVQEYTGGHGKVWDYFNHALALGWDARVYLTPGSRRDRANPWMSVPGRIEPQWQPGLADALFLGGHDWSAVPEGTEHRVPVINLVQGLRHADAALPLHGYLGRQARRICVGQPVADAIGATGRLRGPTWVIPAALNLPPDVAAQAHGGQGVFVAAQKNRALGQELAASLRGKGIEAVLAEEWMPRQDYLQALARAQVAVVLPLPAEGFFLPGLEAMALGCAVAMPDAIGNRQYAIDGVNCLMPAATPEAMAQAVERMLGDAALRARLRAGGRETAAGHSLSAEREAFAAVLADMQP